MLVPLDLREDQQGEFDSSYKEDLSTECQITWFEDNMNLESVAQFCLFKSIGIIWGTELDNSVYSSSCDTCRHVATSYSKPE